MKTRVRWAGHVSRKEDHRLPKITINYGERSTDHRDRGAPKKRYKDCLKKSLRACHIDHSLWCSLATDRNTWRRTIISAVSSFEKPVGLPSRKNDRENLAAAAPNPDQTFTCRPCNRTCRSCIGLVSHERACRRRGPSP